MELQEKLQAAIDNNLSGNTSMSKEGVYEFQSAAVCVDNSSGNVAAIVGSRSQDLKGYTLNRAYQSYRQPGSSIKPLIVYTPYLQKEKTPDSVVEDFPIENGPKNADGTYAGTITLREAVKWSKNTVAWNIYQEITPRAGATFLLNMGFHKVWMDKEYNAVALGGFTYGVSTEEMAGAYAVLANDGVYKRTTCIRKIINSSGKTVVDEDNRSSVRIFDINSCRMMTDMLKTVIESGTGTNAQVENAIVAGKTGTTNDDKDAWFCGYSKYYTTAVWVGYDMPRTIAAGGKYTAAIWSDFMSSVHEKLEKVEFPPYSKEKSEETVKKTEAAGQNTETAG
ncbi:MAG: penicillin-binding transpeptidase domain-containing protein, partial [Eubacteriales bacterium]|nr:penicillin-binding transpeptidase domain-containing protein [Eubacteriales bacterium]